MKWLFSLTIRVAFCIVVLLFICFGNLRRPDFDEGLEGFTVYTGAVPVQNVPIAWPRLGIAVFSFLKTISSKTT